MRSIILKNEFTGTLLEARIFKDGITFFVLPRKHSTHWIPITTTKEEYKEIKKALNSRKEA